MRGEAIAEVVRNALREAGLSEIISEFDMADLVKLHNGAYTSAKRLTAAREQDLYKCDLAPALVGLLLQAVGPKGEFTALREASHARSYLVCPLPRTEHTREELVFML